MKFAILLNLFKWDENDTKYLLDQGITFINLNYHPAGQLYIELCENENIDQGEPSSYDTALILHDETNDDMSFFPTTSQYSLTTKIINLLTILCRSSIGDCRVISSKDDFKTSHLTYLLYENQTEIIVNLNKLHKIFEFNSFEILKIVWNNLKDMHSKDNPKSRISNALNFFYLSWNTLTLEQTCICLSVVNETLFAPHSNNELSHQIAYNIAKFLGTSKDDKIEMYSFIKKQYSIRSKLVHGNTINDDELKSISVLFEFSCDIFKKILCDSNLINTFNVDSTRTKFLTDQLFD